MRSLAVWTTTAAVALLGVANAQTTDSAAPAAQSTSGDIQTAITAYAAYQNDVSELRAARIGNARRARNRARPRRAPQSRRPDPRLGRLRRIHRRAIASLRARRTRRRRLLRPRRGHLGAQRRSWLRARLARRQRSHPHAARLRQRRRRPHHQRRGPLSRNGLRPSASALGQWRRAATSRPRAARALARRCRRTASRPCPPIFRPASRWRRSASRPAPTRPSFGGRRFWDAAPRRRTSWKSPPPRSATNGASTPRAAKRSTAWPRSPRCKRSTPSSDHQSAASQLMSDPRSRDCIEMAQLQLYQCMSAARFRYENAFCLGQHGLRDIGLCIGAVALPDTSAMTPISAPSGRRNRGASVTPGVAAKPVRAHFAHMSAPDIGKTIDEIAEEFSLSFRLGRALRARARSRARA